MNNDLRFDSMMKSIDVFGRLAFGGQCVGAMAIIAGPLIFIVACVLPFMIWHDNHVGAIGLWLGGWLLAVAVTAAGVAFAVFCWRWSGDWITEWPGYAVGFGIAGIADAINGYLLTSTPVPIYGSFLMTMAGAFVAGLLVAGHLGGMRVLPDQREERQRAIARRR
jgi:hypothetical protein